MRSIDFPLKYVIFYTLIFLSLPYVSAQGTSAPATGRNVWDLLGDVADKYLGGDKGKEASAAPVQQAAPATPAVTAGTPSTPKIDSKRYLGELDFDLERVFGWALVKSGSWAGRCVVPDVIDMNGKAVSIPSRYQAQYFKHITGLVQFYPHESDAAKPRLYKGAVADDFLRWLAGKGCYAEAGRAVLYTATMMIDLDVIRPELNDTAIEAQIIQLRSIPGYVLAKITKVGTHPQMRDVVGACVDFHQVYRSDGTPIRDEDIQSFVKKTITGFLSFDPRTTEFVKQTQMVGSIHPMRIMQAAAQEGACRPYKGLPLRVRVLESGWAVDAAKLVEWVNPYKNTTGIETP